MKKSIIAATLAVLATAASINTAAAQTPWVDQRERNQGVRIFHGIANGSLTVREAGSLIRGQARIRAAERRYKADGVVTPRERIRLHCQLNRQNRRIWRKKPN